MKPMQKHLMRWTLGVVVFLAGLSIVLPGLAIWLAQTGLLPEGLQDWLPAISVVQSAAMQVFVVAWFFFLGACFASFLNVVAWRVPRGRGINGSSHCPHCNVKLSMTDNIPIAGWLRNSGRCRTCRTPISPRYLLVEVLLGVVTLVLITLEVFWAGVNLPGFQIESFSIIDHLIMDQRVDLLWFAGSHLVLVYSLFTMTVVRTERLAIPAAIAMCGGLIGIGLLLAIPGLTLIPWASATAEHQGMAEQWFHGQPITMLLGGLVGSGIGWAVGRIPQLNSSEIVDPWVKDQQTNPSPAFDAQDPEAEPDSEDRAELEFESTVEADHEVVQEDPEALQQEEAEACVQAGVDPPPNDPAMETNRQYPQVISIDEGVATLGLVGLFLGWQAAITVSSMVLLMAIPAMATAGRFYGRQGTLAGMTFLATLVYLCLWRWLVW